MYSNWYNLYRGSNLTSSFQNKTFFQGQKKIKPTYQPGRYILPLDPSMLFERIYTHDLKGSICCVIPFGFGWAQSSSRSPASAVFIPLGQSDNHSQRQAHATLSSSQTGRGRRTHTYTNPPTHACRRRNTELTHDCSLWCKMRITPRFFFGLFFF